MQSKGPFTPATNAIWSQIDQTNGHSNVRQFFRSIRDKCWLQVWIRVWCEYASKCCSAETSCSMCYERIAVVAYPEEECSYSLRPHTLYVLCDCCRAKMLTEGGMPCWRVPHCCTTWCFCVQTMLVLLQPVGEYCARTLYTVATAFIDRYVAVVEPKCGLKEGCPVGEYAYSLRTGEGIDISPTICFDGQ